MKDFIKETIAEAKEAPNSEKFWTSILLILWVILAIYSMPYFLLAQIVYIFIIMSMAREYSDDKEWPWLWLGTSVIILCMTLITVIAKSIEVKVTNPIKRFNNWLNNKKL